MLKLKWKAPARGYYKHSAEIPSNFKVYLERMSTYWKLTYNYNVVAPFRPSSSIECLEVYYLAEKQLLASFNQSIARLNFFKKNLKRLPRQWFKLDEPCSTVLGGVLLTVQPQSNNPWLYTINLHTPEYGNSPPLDVKGVPGVSDINLIKSAAFEMSEKMLTFHRMGRKALV